MAQQESDREDLMREAVALVPRIELQIAGDAESTVVGRRRDGHLSIYFGQDSAYHFDPAGRLRRSYCRGFLYRSEAVTLARLERVRTSEETTLSRMDLDEQGLARFLRDMDAQVLRLRSALANQEATVLQQIPVETEFVQELPEHLEAILQSEPRLSPGMKR